MASMNKERSLHSCGKMNINGKIIFVVAGGIGSKCNLDSVEILDPCYFGNRWKLGPKLPYKLRGSAMITSPTGRGVVVIGGYNHNEYKYSNAVLELTDNAKKWITLEQSLQYSRSN